MKYEDITVSGSISISGSFNVPNHASSVLANQATGSLFFDTTDKLFKVFQSGAGALNIASQPFTPPPPVATGDIKYLVIAGGGSGGRDSNSGGGGAGGLRTSYGSTSGGGSSAESNLSSIASGSIITVTIGAGGADAQASAPYQGNDGSDSSIASSTGTSFTTVTSTGGGGGAGQSTQADGRDGGSGGGGSYDSDGGSGTSGQGYAGGDGVASGDYPGGGGGGAAELGNTDGQGHGGDGLAVSITGTSITYAGGGGAGRSNGTGDSFPGGDGGGGQGTAHPNGNTPGQPNTGGGGGGYAGGDSNRVGENGGSGVVILRYPSSSIGAVGGTELKSNSGERIHLFNSSGTLAVGSSTTTPPTDSHYPSTVTKPNVFINPRALGADGTFTTIPDYGTVGRDFYNAGGSNNTKINTAGGSYDALDTAYGSGARGFAAGSTSLGTTYSDYNTNQHHSYNCFFRYDPSMQSDTNYPLLWIVKPNTADSSTSYYGGMQIAVWRGGLTQTGKIYTGLYNVSGGSNVHGTTQTSTVTSGDTWYMCTSVITYGSSGNIKMYLNGSLNVTSSTADNTGTGGSSGFLGLGESYATNAAYNYGGMSFGVSHAWFGTALTATDVTNLWNFYKADYGLS